MRILSLNNMQMSPTTSFGAGFVAFSRASGPSVIEDQITDLNLIKRHLEGGSLKKIDPELLKYTPTPHIALGNDSVKMGLAKYQGEPTVILRAGDNYKFHSLWKHGDEGEVFIKLFDSVVAQLRKFAKSRK